MIEAELKVIVIVEDEDQLDYAIANIQSNMDYDNIKSKTTLISKTEIKE